MGRAPCCEKIGLKKGPWTPEEDQILVSYIRTHGHPNWRALPKLAGLLRCGKSCRLRWINYLRPDIKRGNFSVEEEETIIKLHETLGNRWSAIAARLPGRTDNEIKNVWHTHLKKRLKNRQEEQQPITVPNNDFSTTEQPESGNFSKIPTPYPGFESPIMSPHPTSSDDHSSATDSTSSITTAETNNKSTQEVENRGDPLHISPVIDDFLWSGTEIVDNPTQPWDIYNELHLQYPFISADITDPGYGAMIDDGGMEYWYNLLVNAGGYMDYHNYQMN